MLQRELEVLSVQHTQKCLENSQLNQELQDERLALLQCQKENQELKTMQVLTFSPNKALKKTHPAGMYSMFQCECAIFPVL